MTPPKTIGIVGCGLIADTHVEAIREAAPGFEISVCDGVPGKAELLRRKYALKSAYCRIGDMLEAERPFAVHILSPPQMHIAHARQCVEAGSHVLVEKPLCFASEEARDLLAVGRKRGKIVCVDHSLLFQPSVERMLCLLRQNPHARVLHVRSFYGLEAEGIGKPGRSAQAWKQYLPGGWLMDALVHPITLAVEVCGTPDHVVANSVERDGQIQELLVSWESQGSMVALTVSAGSQPFRRITEVVTTEGTFTIDHSTEVLVVSGAGAGPNSIKKIGRNLGFAGQLFRGTLGTVWSVARGRIKQNPGARALVGAFYRHLEGRGDNPVSVQNVLHTVQALESAATVLSNRIHPGPPSAASTPNRPASAEKLPTLTTLVTGASGFLGRAVCEHLVGTERRRILGVVRRGPNAERLPATPLLQRRFLDFDFCAQEDYQALLAGVNEVVHCAHASHARTWATYKSENVDTTIALYEAAAKAGCKRFIHISSVAVYGVQNREPNTIDENAPIRSGNGGWDFYIRSKAEADACLLERARKGGPELVILRPGILYSAAGERLLSRSVPMGAKRVFIEFGHGDNHLPYTRVDVLAQAIGRLLDQSPFPQGVYNVTGNCRDSARAFKIARLDKLGVHAQFLSLPAWPLRIGASALEAAYWLARRQRAPKLTRYVLDSAQRDLLYSTRRAEKAFGWNPDEAVRI